jgi:DNA-binding transcriptional ArsR family regulator
MTYQLVLDALGDPTRRAVYESLRDGPRSVGAIAAGLPVSRPAVSQHLRVLKEAGLVRDRRDGRKRLYEQDVEGLAVLRAYVETMWRASLDAFKSYAERPAKERGGTA